MQEFKVNEYIKLRLEDEKTVIYVAGKRFSQCKHLLLNIPVNKIEIFNDISSIDDSEVLYSKLKRNIQEKRIIIPLEAEFWGHCSNLQVWVENDYNTRLIHRNLAFPLLKKLYEIGDPIARKVFKEEISKRLSSLNPLVIEYLFMEGYVDCLNEDEIKSIFDNETLIKLLYSDWNYDFFEKIIKNYTFEVYKIIRNEFKHLINENLELAVKLLYSKNYIKLFENRTQFWEILNTEGKILQKIENKIISHNKKKLNFKLCNNLDYDGIEPMTFIYSNNKITGLNIWNYNNDIELPKTIFRQLKRLKNLKYLRLNNVGLKKIPKSIRKLKCLEVISLENNKLTKIPKFISQLVRIKLLDLSNNGIKSILELNSLKSLEELYLHGNKLEKLPEFIKKLELLNVLTISDNPLDIKNIKELKKIKFIDY